MYPPPFYSVARPMGAFVTSLVGGIFILLGGATQLLVGGFFFGFFVFGLLGIVFGVIIIGLSVMVYQFPQHHMEYGVFILVLSIASLVSSFGGFVIGFVLGLVGGILGMTWKPSMPFMPYPSMFGGFPPPPPAVAAIPNVTRACLKCGRLLSPEGKFCPHCGNPLT